LKADYLFVGLGNPGSKYAFTRHNIGFLCIDILVHAWNAQSIKLSNSVEAFKANVSKKDIILIKPKKYMNLSGQALSSVWSFHKDLKPNGNDVNQFPMLLTIHDEVDLPFNKLKLKFGGGDAGHNGLKDIRKFLHGNYCRLRFGVGRPSHASFDLADYVLQNFSSVEKDKLKNTLPLLADFFEFFISNDVVSSQEKINSFFDQ